MSNFTFPKGAIQSPDQVWFGRRLWDVVNSNGFREIEEVVIARAPVIGSSYDKDYVSRESFWTEFRHNCGLIVPHSLRDRNIGAHYNNNFLFASEEDARAFLESS